MKVTLEQAVIVVGIIGVSLLFLSTSQTAERVNATTETYEIRVPEDFGKTVSIAKSESYGYISILFENGVLYTYVEQGTPYRIVWEES